ncbi:DUF192 domain-containing protein [Marinobacter sp. S6332]|uniref:DUF192 domain-containing protein n=1 Tax=Marinobacter sp. S6332 TaxID=2926403 RepID=UPI001FF120EE|nr:DUF192 domain-containing protein [Marinobacter sp. S6332]MCK0164142.1 DUF192 domain-containing protein [Marinobacter sp. S6332]
MRNYGTALSLAAMLAGCSGSGAVEPSVSLPVHAACFVTDSNTVRVQLEVADTAQERRKGLMGRESLAADAGMLFQYKKVRGPDYSFWMYQTLIPLDIAYLDEQGIIGNIRQMEPCESTNGARCPSYPAEIEFVSAVEMNMGFFEASGIGVGDRLKLGEINCSSD